MDNSNNSNDNNLLSQVIRWILIIGSILILIIPVAVNLLLYLPVPTPGELGNSEWLSFWGSYIGGCLGGICTLLTIYLTIKYYEKQDANHEIELEMQNIRHEQEFKEEILRRYRPLLILQPNGGSGSNGKYNPFSVHVNNVSEYVAVNVKIDDQYEALIKSGDEKVFRIKSTVTGGGYNEFLTVTACDVIGNEYVWKYQLQVIDGIRKEDGTETTRHYYRIVEEKRR